MKNNQSVRMWRLNILNILCQQSYKLTIRFLTCMQSQREECEEQSISQDVEVKYFKYSVPPGDSIEMIIK